MEAVEVYGANRCSSVNEHPPYFNASDDNSDDEGIGMGCLVRNGVSFRKGYDLVPSKSFFPGFMGGSFGLQPSRMPVRHLQECLP